MFSLIEETNVHLEESQFSSQVGGSGERSNWNRKSFVFQLLAIDDNHQAVEGRVDGHAAVDPCHMLDSSCVCCCDQCLVINLEVLLLYDALDHKKWDYPYKFLNRSGMGPQFLP